MELFSFFFANVFLSLLKRKKKVMQESGFEPPKALSQQISQTVRFSFFSVEAFLSL